MKTLICLFLLSVALISCDSIHSSWNGVHGNGELKTEERTVAAFTKVIVDGSMDVKLTAGNSTQTMDIRTDSNILPLIKTEVENGTLRISSEKSFSTKKGILVTIAVPMIEAVRVNGSGDVAVKNINSETFSVDVHGSSDMAFQGTAKNFNVDIYGSGDVNAVNLNSENSTIKINGSGDVDVTCTSSLTVNINGSGDVTYGGNPTNVKKVINGSGDCSKR